MSRVIDAILRLTDNFTTPMSKAVESMTSGSKAAVKIAKDVEKAGKKISGFGNTLTTSLTLPIAGVATATTKMALDFEDGIAKVTTIADMTKTSLDQIKSETLALSRELGVGVTEISEAQYSAISAGAATEHSLELVRTATLAAKAGFTDTATAVDGLTTVFNSYQGAVDYGKIADQMMMTQNYGKTTFGELASSMGQVTPIAQSLNVSTDELFGSIAILTKNGIATSSAVTGMKAAYSNILKPTSDAAKEAQRLGIEFNAAHLKTVGWAQFLSEIKEKTQGNTESMAKLFGSVEALNSISVLAGAGFEDFNTALGLMNNSAGLTQQSYEKMLTPAQRMQIALNKIKVTGIQVGERLLPYFEKMITAVDNIAGRLAGLSDEQIEGIMKIAGVAAMAGPAISIFGKLVTGAGTVLRLFNQFKRFAKTAKTIGGAIKLLITPVNLVVVGVAAAIAVVAIIIKNIDKFKAGLNACAPAFQKTIASFKAIADRIAPLIPIVKQVGSVIWDAFQISVVAAVTGAIGAVAGFLTDISGIVDGILLVFSGVITFVKGVFTGDWELAWKGVETVFRGVFETILAIAKSVVNGVSGAINGVLGVLNGITIPDWVPGIGGSSINIPLLPMLARGTNNWGGGLAQVHERGGEIIDLPEGSRVYPHDKTVSMAREQGRREGLKNVTIAKLADQIIVREDADIDRIADALLKKLQKAAMNMGGVSVGDLA